MRDRRRIIMRGGSRLWSEMLKSLTFLTGMLARKYLWCIIVPLLFAGVCYADETWTGLGVNQNWSTGANWSGGVPPVSTDIVTFSAAGSGSQDVVDTNFTIAGLQYIGNCTQTTSLNGSGQLQINGPTDVGIGDSTNGGTVTWTSTSGGNINIGSASTLQSFGIGINNANAASGTTSGSLSLGNITVSALVSELAIGSKTYNYNTTGGGATGSLVLGSNSTLVVGSAAKPATLTIGENDDGGGTVTGTFNATQGTPELYLGTMNVGYSSGGGAATGTLVWNQATPINATNIYFGRGVGTGVLSVPAGGSFLLGTATTPIGTLGIGYNDSAVGSGAGTAVLDFTATNPTFTAYVGSELAIGSKTYNYNTTGGGATGSLVLGSNSTLVVGSAAKPATLTIGENDDGGGTVTGTFNATQGTPELYLGTMNVGYSSGGGAATGTLVWNQATPINATNIYFGRGVGTGVLSVPAGGSFLLGTATTPIGTLGIGYNDSAVGSGAGTAVLDFTATNPTFTAYVGSELAIGSKTYNYNTTGGGATGSLVLGSNSTLVVGSAAKPATLTIGENDDGGGTVTGTFNATQGTPELYLGTMNVGYSSGGGAATGTLVWNQATPINATNIYFGRGVGTGVLSVPAGGSFLLGTATTPIGTLGIGYNDSAVGSGAGTAVLDFTATNPTFTAYVGSELAIGSKTYNYNTTGGGATGSLVLGSNSTLVVGSAAKPATLTIGENDDGGGTVTGTFNATQGTPELYLGTMNVGYSSGGGAATGTLVWNQATPINATNIYFGRGVGTGVLSVPAGGSFLLGTATTPIGTLGIGYNDSAVGSGAGTAVLDFTATNPTFTAYVGSELAIGSKTYNYNTTGGGATGSLVLGSNSTLVVGSAAKPATLTIGENDDGGGTVTGTFNATQGTPELYLGTMNVGYSSGGGAATGTLVWNQATPINATNIYFGRGVGTGVLSVPAGGSFLLGTATTPIGTLGIGYNDSAVGSGAGTAVLDFTATNPTFTAYVGSELAIGSKTYNYNTTGGGATGSLVLGSNSTLVVGSAAKPATLTIGENDDGGGTVTGTFNATQGTSQFNLKTLNVGTSSGGTATGTMTIGNGSSGQATTMNVGTGSNATGTFNLTGGLLVGQTINIGSGGTFNFTGGRLAPGTFNGALNQQGGTLAPGNLSAGLATINGNYNMWSSGTLEIQLLGATANSLYDQLNVKGNVNLNYDGGTGGKLNTILGFAPTIGKTFTIVEGSSPINGFFSGLPNGSTFTEVYGNNIFTFDISYNGSAQDNIVLNTVNESPVPIPPTIFLFVPSLVALVGFRRKYMR